ncbi:hypothetical protein [Enterococcus pingfangensis]|uniref:hypothetical protein n=1 Tax=Enterococcus pingfangensis TaxID=2559924 RepID=UPI0014858D07|nr:hypothetical protein [Enterococcus pingfangensis]
MKKFWVGIHSLMVVIILFSSIFSAASIVYGTEKNSSEATVAASNIETKASDSAN